MYNSNRIVPIAVYLQNLGLNPGLCACEACDLPLSVTLESFFFFFKLPVVSCIQRWKALQRDRKLEFGVGL